jgi:hypothetical protein
MFFAGATIEEVSSDEKRLFAAHPLPCPSHEKAKPGAE